jgi:hypothetical protein
MKPDDIDALEAVLLKNTISLESMRDHFAALVSNTIDRMLKADTDSNETLRYLRESLTRINNLRAAGKTGKIPSHDFEEVWNIERRYRTSNPPIAGLARCVIQCLAGYETWSENNQGDLTPLFYLYFDIKKINSEIESEFIDHFYKLII